MTDPDLLSIGAFSAATDLSIPALRHYDEIGLLKPAHVDAVSGYRRYQPQQLEVARLICTLRAVDLPIDEIRLVLADSDSDSDQQPRLGVTLDAHRERLVSQIRDLTQRVRALDEFTTRGTALPPLQAVRPAMLRLPVADMAASAKFYTTAFDVLFLEDIHALQFGTYRSERFFLIILSQRRDGPAGQSGANAPTDPVSPAIDFGLLVDDLDAAHRQALAAGADEIHPPRDFSYMPRTSSLHDPDGHTIHLTQA